MMKQFATLLLLMLALSCRNAASFCLAPNKRSSSVMTPTRWAARQDHVVPDEVRAERSQWIRDKLIGQAAAEEEAENKKANKKPKKHSADEDGNPHLTEMIKVLEEHIVHEELVDPNC